MSYVLPTSLPSSCREAATGLARHLREQAMTTEAIEWTGSAPPSDEVPFRWHAMRFGRDSVRVTLDPCQGRVFSFDIDLPERE